MKKTLILLICIFALCACSNKYTSLGYSKEVTKLIDSLSDEDKALFENYDEKLEALLASDNFDINKFSQYKEFIDVLDADSIIELVNNIDSSKIELIKKLATNSDFDVSKIDEYLEVSKEFDDADTIIEIANDNLTSYSSLIKAFMSDPYYIAENLPLYIQYRNDETIREQVEYVNTLRYLTYFEDGMYAEPDKYGYTVNVNKYYYLGEDYNPDDVVALTGEGDYGSLRQVVKEAYDKMRAAASEDGVYFYATSSYRSYETQVKIYNRYLETDSQEVVDTYSARPGFSDHQTGMTVDILSAGYDFGNFYASDASDWLAKNAYKYGFICRYPEGYEDATGYEYEPWHYRYVGDIAEDVYNKGISYDEYFEKYVKER